MRSYNMCSAVLLTAVRSDVIQASTLRTVSILELIV